MVSVFQLDMLLSIGVGSVQYMPNLDISIGAPLPPEQGLLSEPGYPGGNSLGSGAGSGPDGPAAEPTSPADEFAPEAAEPEALSLAVGFAQYASGLLHHPLSSSPESF